MASTAVKVSEQMNRSFSTSLIRTQARYRLKCVCSVPTYASAPVPCLFTAALNPNRKPILTLRLTIWLYQDDFLAIQNPKR